MPTIYLIRHAKAEPRELWALPDSERPLTRRGREQARLIASHLSDFGRPISRILSSPAVRCGETVSPLSEAAGLPPIDANWLMEGNDGVLAFDRLRRLARQLDPPSGIGGPVAACSHGDVIWEVLRHLYRRGVDLGPQPEVPKGGVWILGVPARGTITAEFFQPDTRRDRQPEVGPGIAGP